MARWLLKTEPDCYSWEQLVKDKKTSWDGVTNALALKHLRTMNKGDEALIYHTGDEKAVVGVADVTSAPYADPKEGDERLVVVDLRRTAMGLALAYLASRVATSSDVVRYDAPASVRSAYTPEEALALAERAGLRSATVRRVWPQRYVLEWERREHA